MLTFYNEKGEGFGAQVEFTVKNAVNGERSVSGTIISNDRVLSKIDRGWKFEFDGEFYNIVYAKPRDEGRNLSVSFDAVHQFFYDFGHSNCYTEFNGSHRFEVYIEAIFKDSGYRYQIEPRVRVNSIRKENFGNSKRLEMFKDIIKAAGLEFSVSGKVVLITKKIGADLSTVVRKNFNMNELVIEKNINKFITYKRGLGAWKDEEDHSKGRYTTEYESPLASIYGRIEGEPVTDERYKDTGQLLRRLKFEVDNSYSISVQLDMEDLTRAGYQYTQPRAGDYIMAINEMIGFWEKIRIVSFESSYDVTGRLINHKVTCNDIGSVQKQISSEGSIIRNVGQSKEYAESALAVATKALASADGKNTVYYGATKPKDEPIGTIHRGDILYLTAGEDTEMYIWNGAEWELRKLKLDTAELEKEFDKVKKAAEQASEENKRRSDEALKKAGASEDLAKEAKRIGLDSIAKLEEFKRQATGSQTALSGDLDVLKRTVNNEVNQASEHRRTTTEALSRMTGQMNGFATKSEVAQGIDGLTQTFAKMKVGGRNLIRNYDWNDLLPLNIVGSGWKFERVEDQFAKSRYMLKATCTKAGNVGFHRNLFDLRSDEFQGKDMTWSWEMKTSRPITFYDMGFEAGGLKKNVPISTEWTRITNTFQVAFNRFYSCVFYANGWEVGDVVYIRDPQLEEGTIATTPRPAPEDGKDEILAARTEFKQTADGLSIKMATVENYVSQDGQRQETLRKYTRDETARQVNAVRELVTRDYVGKSTLQESIQGVERRLESYSLGISGNLLKNSNDGFRNQHAKSYRIVETLQANQTYTLVTKYWHGEKSTGHTFSDGSGNLRHLTYNRAIDAWMVQFTPKENISQGTELTLSSHPSDGLGNMAWATLVRGHIPLTYWQPAKSDVEEGITQKLAEYKETIDGRFADITSLISGKANQTDFQRVQETSKLYERIIGSNENDISNKVARMALTNQLFQVEVGKVTRGGRNLIRNYDWNGLLPLQKLGTDWKFERIADKNAKSGYVLKATCTQGGAGGFYKTLFDLSPDEFQGKDMTSSWDMKASRSITFNAMGFEAGGLKRDVPVSTEWTRITNTFKVAFKQYYSCVFYANGWQVGDVVYIRDPQLEEGPIATSPKRAPEDTDEAIRTVQTQLAGSWAVKNLTNSGDVLNSINLLANGTNRIDGRLTHITGQTLIDNAVIKDGMIANVSANKLTAGTIDARTVNLINLNANNVTSGTFRGLTFEGGIVRGNNGNTVINLNDNVTTYNGYAKIEFKSPGNSLEFNSGGRKAFLAPTIAQGTSYAAFAFGVNDRGDCDPNRDFVGLKIFNQPGVRRIDIIGDLTLTRYEEHGIKSTSLQKLFELINDNFKRLREFRVQNGEGSPGFWDVSI